MFLEHEKTFLLVKRNLENEEEHEIAEKEMKSQHSITTHKCHTGINPTKGKGFQERLNIIKNEKYVFHFRSPKNPEIPNWIAEKYRSVYN